MLPAMINTAHHDRAYPCSWQCRWASVSAIYLVEYAGRGNKLVSVVRITAETLSGIPSIVYGLFGFLFFVVSLRAGATRMLARRLDPGHHDPAL